MKFTRTEQEHILNGELTIRRPLRGRRCTLKIGDTAQAGTRYFAVRSIRKDRTDSAWSIQLEEVGEWAMLSSRTASSGTPEMPLSEALKHLPDRLEWAAEPETRAGDMFILAYGTVVYRDGSGKPHRSTYPEVYLLVTGNPIRHKNGRWHAPYRLVGFDRVEFMRRAAGTTPNPRESIDPEVPLEHLSITVADKELNRQTAERRRRETRRAEKTVELSRAKGPGAKARLTRELSELDEAA